MSHRTWLQSSLIIVAFGILGMLARGEGTNNQTNFSNSSTTSYLTVVQTVDQRTSAGLIQNIINGGDQVNIGWTAGRPLSDPKVQAALGAALKVLKAQLPPFPQGATTQVLSRTPGSGGTSSTTTTPTTQPTGNPNNWVPVVTTYIGPLTIHIGVDQMTPFTLAGGQVDIDVLTNTEYYQYQTTTLSGGTPTVETLLQQRIITLDLDAVFSLVDSGLPIALALRESLVNAHSGGLGDVNDRIFRLWLGPNDTEPQGDKSTPENAPFGGDVRFFASGNAGFLSQNAGTTAAGLRDTRESGTVGAELKVSPKFRIGAAATYVHSDTDFSGGLGSQHIDGAAVSLYATVREERWFADLLYSVGLFSDTTDRNTLLGSNARGTSGDVSHLVSLNTGWLFKVGDAFATGPYASLTYVHGDLAGTTESGGGSANLVRSAQSYDSLVSTVGWQANWKLRRSWGALKPLVHIGWERENLSDAGAAGVTLLQSPFSFSGGSSFGSFGVNTRRESARYDALVAGVILGVDLGDRWSVSLRATERTDLGPRNDFSIAASAGLRF